MPTEAWRSNGGTVSRVVLVVVATVILCSCDGVERVFVYDRKEPAAGRRTPTRYVVRIKLDEERRTVGWVEDVSDGEGYLGRNLKSYDRCEFFSRTNWKCIALRDSDEIEMRDGRLHQLYWSERDRVFSNRYKIGNTIL